MEQMYLDWIYLWCLSYYANLSGGITIMAKASLKWIPILGWASRCPRDRASSHLTLEMTRADG